MLLVVWRELPQTIVNGLDFGSNPVERSLNGLCQFKTVLATQLVQFRKTIALIDVLHGLAQDGLQRPKQRFILGRKT